MLRRKLLSLFSVLLLFIFGVFSLFAYINRSTPLHRFSAGKIHNVGYTSILVICNDMYTVCNGYEYFEFLRHNYSNIIQHECNHVNMWYVCDIDGIHIRTHDTDEYVAWGFPYPHGTNDISRYDCFVQTGAVNTFTEYILEDGLHSFIVNIAKGTVCYYYNDILKNEINTHDIINNIRDEKAYLGISYDTFAHVMYLTIIKDDLISNGADKDIRYNKTRRVYIVNINSGIIHINDVNNGHTYANYYVTDEDNIFYTIECLSNRDIGIIKVGK